jgi:DNA repair protein RecO (recombination protein O)
MAVYKTEAIVLRRINFGEADKILTVFSKHYGKIRLIAKGIRKMTSRKGGSLELFNRVTLFLVRGRNLDLVSEVQVKDSFSGFRKDLERVSLAYYLCELVDKLCPDRQSHEEIFSLLVKNLAGLEKPDLDNQERDKMTQSFEKELLKILGFWPEEEKKTNAQLFIEEIIERKLKAPRFLTKLN